MDANLLGLVFKWLTLTNLLKAHVRSEGLWVVYTSIDATGGGGGSALLALDAAAEADVWPLLVGAGAALAAPAEAVTGVPGSVELGQGQEVLAGWAPLEVRSGGGCRR